MPYRFLTAICLLLLCLLAPSVSWARQYTLVIDAGHGGRDAGAVGARSKEKNLTLTYALAFGKMVERNCPDVKVIYTRKSDRFLELWQRAEIANKNKADLFISVHINSLPKGHQARGFQTYTLGRGRTSGSKQGFIENLEVAKRENSVIFLEKDYKQTYQGYDPNSPESDILFEFMQDENMVNSVELAKLMQKHVCAATGRKDQGAHQDNLAVLRLTSMPGCLVELGFISTRDEEQFLNADSSPERYARGMLNAFQAYRRRTDKSVPTPKMEATVAKADTQKADSRRTESTRSETPNGKRSRGEASKQETDGSEASQSAAAKTDSSVVRREQKKAPQDSADDDAPVFKVQFLTSEARLKAGSKAFKGLADVHSYKEKGLWKYTVGASTDLNAIQRLRREVAKTFPQAFIVAFKNGERMDLEKARQESRRKKQ